MVFIYGIYLDIALDGDSWVVLFGGAFRALNEDI